VAGVVIDQCKEYELRGRLSTVDLLIKATCFVKVLIKKELIRTSKYKEVNCTKPSPSVRLPWPL
jgi:hypothetical protein